mmetsp:Transcript_31722/g.94929  ORF Transcript_31722/g.94929 Transcript_31722/m.94929 type:complete len:557 (-) Transcript_31722:611-2281(-)
MAMAMINDASGGGGSSRKRPRSGSPLPPATAPAPSTGPASDDCSDAPTLAASIRSSEASTSAAALNALLRTSADDRANYALGKGGKEVVDALVETFDGAIRWDRGDDIFDVGADDEADLNPSAGTWYDGGRVDSDEDAVRVDDLRRGPVSWSSFCCRRLAPPMSSPHIHPSDFVTDADVRTLDVVVTIIRNLSYVAGNQRYLAHSPGVLRILGGCLYYRAFSREDEEADAAKFGRGATTSASNHNVCVHALHALLNLAPMLDPTGRRVFTDRVLLDPTTPGSEAASVVPHDGDAYGQAKSLGLGGMLIARRFEVRDEALSKVPDDVVRSLTAPLIRAVLSLFPALLYSLHCECNRPVVSCTLEVLSAVADNADNRGAFLGAPDALLSRLVDLLYVPRLGPDGLEYVDPVKNVVTRVSTLKLMMGYNASIDSECRDRSAEMLVKLTGLGPDLRRRLGRRVSPAGANGVGTVSVAAAASGRRGYVPNTRLYDALIAMLSTTAGRGDASQLAAKLLANLATAPENRDGMLYVEAKALQASSRNPQVANVVCNGIFNHMI